MHEEMTKDNRQQSIIRAPSGLQRFSKTLLGKSAILVVAFFISMSLMGFSLPTPVDTVVYDEPGILNAEETAVIMQLNHQLEPSGAQIAVAVVNDLNGEDLEMAANSVFRKWGIGDAQLNNGILIFIDMAARRIRIEVGYGVEDVVNDAKAGRIIRDIMAPQFKSGHSGRGVVLAVQELALNIANKYDIELDMQGQPVKSQMRRQSGGWSFIKLLFIMYILFRLFGRRNGGRGSGSGLIDFLLLNMLFGGGSGRGRGGSTGGGFGGFGGGSSGGGGASGGW